MVLIGVSRRGAALGSVSTGVLVGLFQDSVSLAVIDRVPTEGACVQFQLLPLHSWAIGFAQLALAVCSHRVITFCITQGPGW